MATKQIKEELIKKVRDILKEAEENASPMQKITLTAIKEDWSEDKLKQESIKLIQQNILDITKTYDYFAEKIVHACFDRIRLSTLQEVENLEVMQEEEILWGEEHHQLNFQNPYFAIILWNRWEGYEQMNEADVASITDICERENLSTWVKHWAERNNVKKYRALEFDAKQVKWSDIGEKYKAYEKPIWTSRKDAENKLRSKLKEAIEVLRKK